MNNKVDQVFSLASVYNSRNLELNSHIILNLTKCNISLSTLTEDSCQSLKSVLIGIIYEEWFELFESNYSQNFSLKDKSHLNEIINTRMNSRRMAQEAFQNILRLKKDSKIESLYRKILFIFEFNNSLILKITNNLFNKIDLSLDPILIENLKNKLIELHEEEDYNLIIELGGFFSICELIEIINIFKLVNFDLLNQVIITSLKIINNLIKNLQNFTRRWFLIALKNCLNRLEFISLTTILLNNISKYDPNSIIQLDLSELYITLLIEKLNLFDLSTLKSVLIMLNNLSLVYPNKSKISMKLSIDFLSLILKNPDEKIQELILRLIKSVSNEIRQEMCVDLIRILVETFLKSSNICLVCITCEILWLLSRKLDKSGHEELISLEIDSKLKLLINSTNPLISTSSLAILKNLYSSTQFISSRLNSSLDLHELISSPSRLSMTSSVHSTSSSSSSSVILTSRYKKQVLDDENELVKKLNLSSESSESITSTESSSSNDTYYLNDSDKSIDDIPEKVIQIQFEEIKCKSIIKNEQSYQKPAPKHVTFNMENNDEIYIEIDANISNGSLNKQNNLIDLNFKSESVVYLNFLNRSRRYQEKKETTRQKCDSISPIRDSKFIKSSKLNISDQNNSKSENFPLEPVNLNATDVCFNLKREHNENMIVKNFQTNSNKLVGLVRPLKA
ncbi:unnamed protein product [Brachionus calyciflorus]|uniref:Uncharacterized protein n=1 Tax=Brachionus calyciflorus TaxID=104777 RepID=A0A813QQL8_9BILA|nr:unnamed protein product [Brachionus calyciflorus]